MAPDKPDKDAMIVTVIVTYQRLETLTRSLERISQQDRRPDHIIVVDNANEPQVKQALTGFSVPSTYLATKTNLGGAGGFAWGILSALALGADWIWLADDDGYPENPQVLSTLLDCAISYGLGEVSPLVVSATNPDSLAFPLRKGLRWRRHSEEITGDFFPNIASLFNGALFTREAIFKVGVPDVRLFIRGDEVEIHRRLVRSSLRFGTCPHARYFHPDGAQEFKPILGGVLHAQYPDSAVKRHYTYRNRGFLLSQKGLRKLAAQEWLRFGWFFLISRKDIAGFNQWKKLHALGRQERFEAAREAEG